ncbi:M20 family metallo-hydrolase [Gudongella sp. DL1XJH-153]|uniref:M20 family metallo-hydrolase n=1 Tax=Gudongella sp. DL1XJH-153 TaxID=3409804 RepID=UPI003BB55035
MFTKVERIKKDIEELAKFNSSNEGGLTRFSLTEEDKLARDYLKAQLSKLNVKVYEDNAGTLFARREGTDPDAPVIMIGSHFDSVKNGGNFDGPAGVVMALEIFRALEENNIETKYPIEFVAMIEEEGGRFGSGVFGSRAMAGLVDYDQLERNKDKDGISMAQAFRDFGFEPEKISETKRNREDVKAFIELHIEQGPILENEGKDVGIVDFIVGINEFKVEVNGRPDHAGTTPMDMRADPLSVASKVVANVDSYPGPEKNGTVATVGVLEVKPGAANIVPAQVVFTVDIRSKDESSIKNVKKKILDELYRHTKDTDVTYTVTEMLDVKPVKMNEEMVSLFKESGEEKGISYRNMISGAGHDAMVMAAVTEVGLIFVPSKDGRSHCKEEWTDYDKLQKGIELIYDTILKLGEAK